MAVVAPGQDLRDAFLDFRRTRNQDIGQRAIAAPALAVAGAAGQPQSARHLIPKYDDPRQFELAKLEAKKDIFNLLRQAERDRLAGAAALSKSLGGGEDTITKMFDIYVRGLGLDAANTERIRASFNSTYGTLKGAGIRAAFSSRSVGSSAASAGGLRSFMENIYNSTDGTLLEGEGLLGVALQEVIYQEQLMLEAGTAPGKAAATRNRALHMLNETLGQLRGKTLDQFLNDFPGDRNADRIREAWDTAKGDTEAAEEIGKSVNLAASAAADQAIDGVYRDTPSLFPPGWIDGFKAIVTDLGLEQADPLKAAAALDQAWQSISPKGQSAPDFGSLDDALTAVDEMSPNLSPNSSKWRIIQSAKFKDWKKLNGFQTDEVAWKALRQMVSEGRQKALAEDRSALRARNEGGVTMESGPSQESYNEAMSAKASSAMDPRGASESGGTSEDGRPRFFVDAAKKVWFQSSDGSAPRPATQNEESEVRSLAAEGVDLLEDSAALEKAKAESGDRFRASQQQAGEGRFRAVLESEKADPSEKPKLPGIHAAASKIGYAVTHPALTLQRAGSKKRASETSDKFNIDPKRIAKAVAARVLGPSGTSGLPGELDAEGIGSAESGPRDGSLARPVLGQRHSRLAGSAVEPGSAPALQGYGPMVPEQPLRPGQKPEMTDEEFEELIRRLSAEQEVAQ